MSNRPQYVFFNENSSNVLVTNTGAPQGCVISPVLFTLYTNDCRCEFASINPILKFADDTAIIGLINNKNEISYRSEVSKFFQWCNTNYLQLNVNKTKEMVIDFGKKDTEIMPLKINDQIIDEVCTYKYLGITIDEKLHWSDHINNIKSKANKRLCFVRKLGQCKVDRTLITLFYKSVIESVLSFCISCWGGNSSKGDRIKVDWIIKISEKFTIHVPHGEEQYNKKTLDKIVSISKDVKHPLYCFLNKSKSNRIDGYSHIMTKTERHSKSFLPCAIRFLKNKNKNSLLSKYIEIHWKLLFSAH